MTLLAQLAASTSPRLTWYADGGAERVELSGRVLVNWIVKAANLLDDEGVDEANTVGVDLPVHWRAAIWSCAAWLRGARVRFREEGLEISEADVIITDDPEFWADGLETVIAVPLAPLALSWPGELPAGVLDGAADLMAQPDVLISPTTESPYDEADGGRVAIRPTSNSWISRAIARWASGGSVVILHDLDDATAARLSTQEAATPAA
ncbi:TIGR03089 family protein [Ruaniaceae bacterium KH17]|nr:TIGR03089 family protein [Ruaniaceae bacterium KH17]